MPRPQIQLQSSTSLTTIMPTLDEMDVDDDDYDSMEEISEDKNANESEPRYNLRSRGQIETEENIEESAEETEAELQLPENLQEIEFDIEDLQGASLDDALETIGGKNKPSNIAGWPNDAYRDFMKLIIDGNISNKIGDKIIKLFNKYSNLEKSPLPKLTKSGKDYLNQINSPSLDFKEKVVATHSEVDFKLYYRLVFQAIQALVQ